MLIAVSLSRESLALIHFIQSVPSMQKSEHGVYIHTFIHMLYSRPKLGEATDSGCGCQNVVGYKCIWVLCFPLGRYMLGVGVFRRSEKQAQYWSTVRSVCARV